MGTRHDANLRCIMADLSRIIAWYHDQQTAVVPAPGVMDTKTLACEADRVGKHCG